MLYDGTDRDPGLPKVVLCETDYGVSAHAPYISSCVINNLKPWSSWKSIGYSPKSKASCLTWQECDFRDSHLSIPCPAGPPLARNLVMGAHLAGPQALAL